MKVAYLIPGLDAMGPNIFTLNLIKGLLDIKEFQCEVFHFNRGKSDTPILDFPVKTTFLDFNQKLDFSGFDIIHSTMPVPDLYVVRHRLYKKHLCVTSMHCFMESDLYQRKGFFKGFVQVQLWKYALNKIKRVVVSSSAMETYYKKTLRSPHDYSRIPYGIPEMVLGSVDDRIIKEIKEFKKGRPALCGCGTLIKRKGFYQLIDYLAHNNNAVTILIGEGVCKAELEEQAEKLGVKDRVLFLGFLRNSYNYYPYFDAYCMSSNSEGFGLAMLEAMCVKTPIICSNLEIYKDYFNEKHVGMFNYGDQEDFNNAADKVLYNKEYYSDASRKLYDNLFSLRAMANKHMDLYKKILA